MKTEGVALSFQHFPQDLANVNEWKIMFDPYIRKSLPAVFTRITMIVYNFIGQWSEMEGGITVCEDVWQRKCDSTGSSEDSRCISLTHRFPVDGL